MAIRLDVQSTVNMREERIAEERKKVFRIIKAVLAAVIGIVIVVAVGAGVATTSKINNVAVEYQKLSASFESMKQTAAETEAYVKEQQAQQSDPGKIDRDMYSASKDGARVCELLDMSYRGELIRDEFKNELYGLTGDTEGVWFGKKLNPKNSPVKWDFLTWYDSTERRYSVVWGCYAPDGDGNPKYLLCTRFGTYNGETHSFSLGNIYYTTFGNMYLNTGRIEDDGSSSVAGDVISAADQLTGDGDSNNSGSQSTPGTLPDGIAPGTDGHSGSDDATQPGGSSDTTSQPAGTDGDSSSNSSGSNESNGPSDSNNSDDSVGASDDVPTIRV